MAGRVGIALVGLVFAAGLSQPGIFAHVVGVIGLLIALAALGLVELAMAIWYRVQR